MRTHFTITVVAIIGFLGGSNRAMSAVDPLTRIMADERVLYDINRLRMAQMRLKRDSDAILFATVAILPRDTTTAERAVAPTGDVKAFDVSVNVEDVLLGRFTEKKWAFVHRHIYYEWGDRSQRGCTCMTPDPLAVPGQITAILYVETVATAAMVVEVYVLPNWWAESAGDAFRYCAKHRELFEKPPSDAGKVELRGLLSGQNALLGIASARILARDSKEIPMVLREVAAAGSIRQAALICALLESAPPEKKILEELLFNLNQLMHTVRAADDLHGIALGLRYASDGRGEVAADSYLLGGATADELRNMSAADRLQPILLRLLHRRYVGLDPDRKDEYMGRLAGAITPYP